MGISRSSSSIYNRKYRSNRVVLLGIFILFITSFFLSGLSFDKFNSLGKEISLIASIRKSPEDRKSYITLSEFYKSKGKYEKGLKVLDLAIKNGFYDDTVLMSKAHLYSVMSDSDMVESTLNQAVQINPYNEWLFIDLAKNYRNNKEFDKSEELLQKSLKINPKNEVIYYSFGYLYLQQERYTDSETAFKKALDLNPNDEYSMSGLGDLYLAQDKLSLAKLYYEKSKTINSSTEQPYFGLGNLYLKAGDYEASEKEFLEALRINHKVDMLLALGRLYFEWGKMDKAQDYFKKVISINPIQGYVALARVYLSQGNKDRAMNIIEKYSSDYPTQELQGFYSELNED